MKKPNAPAYLSGEAKRWWHKIVTEYEFETADSVLMLESALQAFDRWKQAKDQVDREGLTVADRFKQPKPNPACLVERDSRNAMMRALKQLGLDVTPPGAIGRPAGR